MENNEAATVQRINSEEIVGDQRRGEIIDESYVACREIEWDITKHVKHLYIHI